jgi:DNA-binding Lrp family transcriptional regulator
LSVPISILAERIGIDRSNVYRRIMKEGIATEVVPYLAANGGTYRVLAVPEIEAMALEKFYREAKQ